MLTCGRETLGHLDAALRREWLVTNGLGAYAMGTLAGVNTRRYHGLLVAALNPPLGRTMTVAGLETWAEIDEVLGGERVPLSTHEYMGGTLHPDGCRHLESFELHGGTVPTWAYAWGDVRLVRRVWMRHGHQATYVTFTLARGDRPVRLIITPLCTYRDHHAEGPDPRWDPRVEPVPHGVQVMAFSGATPYRILMPGARWSRGGGWYWNFAHRVETYRGLDDTENLWAPGTFTATLDPGETLALVVTTDEDVDLDGEAILREEEARAADLLARAALPSHAPDGVRQLVLAADQFIVTREVAGKPGQTVIAGYPWFSDWGRDTMIALPGLTLTTGRHEVAARILRTFAHFADRGMLPNRFPDEGAEPEYNTVDATLWYFEATRAYHAAAGDDVLLRDLFPILQEIVEWHRRGTRYQIHVDPADGLLYAGEPGVQLTWMDAKVVGDDSTEVPPDLVEVWVVTPRIGKPVEINALWYNALRIIAAFARRLGKPSRRYEDMADQALAGFARFWNPSAGYCHDVIDGPHGDDPALRPNQLLAVSLPHSPLDDRQQRAVVDVCARHLLTSHGLRSLAPDDPAYSGHYGGDRRQRDGAYHQGTVWGWLIGPFVSAHLRVCGDRELARSFLQPLIHHLASHGIGSLSEIFDGDPPHTPRGCIAQAWSVAEVLRAWQGASYRQRNHTRATRPNSGSIRAGEGQEGPRPDGLPGTGGAAVAPGAGVLPPVEG